MRLTPPRWPVLDCRSTPLTSGWRPPRNQGKITTFNTQRPAAMKTDSLFYELFRQWPAVALDLVGLDPATAARYTFRAEELKQTAFRLDGLLMPADDTDDPYVFIEVQFQPDDRLYPRLFAELFLYLHRAPQPRDWRALILYPDIRVERITKGYDLLVGLPLVHRVDLGALSGQNRATPGWELLRLIDADTAVAVARQWLRTPNPALTADIINFIETVLVYKLPRSTREELQTMLGLTDIDLKQTRFYQDVHTEGQQLGEARILRRQLTRRFGPLPDWAEQRLQSAPPADLERWAERVLDAPTLDAVWQDLRP